MESKASELLLTGTFVSLALFIVTKAAVLFVFFVLFVLTVITAVL